MRNHRWPILTLFFLAPAVGELLSGSAPPSEFFHPFSLLVLPALYGSGALLVREVTRRWGKGWLSIFLLGMAYGIYEEGIVVRSFFDPAWPDLGNMAVYGRFWGVNWMWSLELTLYHALVSITIPIMLVELLFPAHREDPWLKRRGMVVSSLLLLLLLAFGPLVGMHASFLALLASVLAMGVLVFLARISPSVGQEPTTKPMPTAAFLVLGCATTIGWVATSWILPDQGAVFPLAFCAGALWPLMAGAALRLLQRGGWSEMQRWGWAFGVLLVFMLLTLAAEAENATRPDDTSGMALVGISFFIFLVWLGFRIRRRTLSSTLPQEILS